MMLRKCSIIGLSAVLLLATAACSSGGTGAESSEGDAKYVLQLTTLSGGFPQGVIAGAEEEAKRLGIVLEIEAPTVQSTEGQISQLDAIKATDPAAIIVQPLDGQALVTPLRKLKEDGVAIITVDTDVNNPDARDASVLSDNRQGGAEAARLIAEALGDDGGKVLLATYTKGAVQSLDLRAEGFFEALAEYPQIEGVGAVYAGIDPATYANLINAEITQNGGLDGIVTTFDWITDSAASIAAASGGDIKVIGYDAGVDQVNALKRGLLQGLISQNPMELGRLAVLNAYNVVNAEGEVEDVIVPVAPITLDSLESGESDEFLYPE